MDRKDLIRRYKETPRPAGVYRVVHVPSGRTLVGSSPDAPAMLNRIRAQLRMTSHRNADLQRDWDVDGPGGFRFEVLDTLELRGEPGDDPSADLAELETLWLEKLSLPGERLY